MVCTVPLDLLMTLLLFVPLETPSRVESEGRAGFNSARIIEPYVHSESEALRWRAQLLIYEAEEVKRRDSAGRQIRAAIIACNPDALNFSSHGAGR